MEGATLLPTAPPRLATRKAYQGILVVAHRRARMRWKKQQCDCRNASRNPNLLRSTPASHEFTLTPEARWTRLSPPGPRPRGPKTHEVKKALSDIPRPPTVWVM